MHLVKLFLLWWFSFGITTVLGMFWLCKQTARKLASPGSSRPVPHRRPELVVETHRPAALQVPLPCDLPGYGETKSVSVHSQFS